ncbi:hypothetical protein QCA50_010595 [Cerrena zonata]|uniref:RING-type E3 ubiquitin transferase n=1 Tax=Cerrena zonata TaxID=2478898 RepID=A0AAW0G9U1_9APHY
MSAQRPRTSKPRGVCRYYTTPRGCFAGSSCKFLHGDEQKLTPYDQSKTCRYYTAGYCRRGADCWFLHSDPGPAAKVVVSPIASDDDDYVCSICLEKPVTFGLLAGCDHIFCLECIRQWRNPPVTPEDGAVDRLKKCCPLCRVASPFVTPSSHFYSSTHPGKAATINQYKASMARVPCRYFQASLHSSQRFCPFGKDCFYQHKNEDGSDHVFAEGVEHYIKPDSGTRSRGRFTFTSSDDYVDTPWIEEMSATLDAIRASLPDFLQQPLDEGEDDSENDDHPHRLQVEQLMNLMFHLME